MTKQPLDYQGVTQRNDARPRVRWQTVISCSLLGAGLVCGLVALVWPLRRSELVSAALSLGIAGVLMYFYVRRM